MKSAGAIRDMPRSTARRAFTLVEALVASGIVSVTVVALVAPFSLAAKHQRLDAVRTTGLGLASEMTERLVTLDYAEVLALNGLTESGSNITDAAGQPMNDPVLAEYTRTIAATETPLALAGQSADEAAVFCCAVVTVSHPDIPDIVITRMFSQP